MESSSNGHQRPTIELRRRLESGNERCVGGAGGGGDMEECREREGTMKCQTKAVQIIGS